MWVTSIVTRLYSVSYTAAESVFFPMAESLLTDILYVLCIPPVKNL